MNAPDVRRPGYTPTRIMPQSYEDVREIAKEAIKAGLFRAPDGTPPDVLQAQCVFAIMTGMDAGMTPSQAVQAIYVKDGKCNIAGQGCLALIWGAGCKVEQVEACEANQWTASCTIIRPRGETITRIYSKADAVRAGLWRDEVDLSSTWWTAQVRMLGWRAVGRAAADGAPDVLRGLHILEVTNDELRARGERIVPISSPPPAGPAVLDVPDDIDQDRAFLHTMTGGDTWDSRRHLDGLKVALENVKTTVDLGSAWDWHLQVSDVKLSSAEDAEADGYFHAAEDRLGG